jgi:hypothetical protein
MGEHVLNIFSEKISRARRLLFSSHDSGTVGVLRTMLVLACAHDRAHASVSEHLNTGWTLCEQQRELRSKCSEMEKGVENNFWVAVTCGENFTLLALFILWTIMFKMYASFLGYSAVVFHKYGDTGNVRFMLWMYAMSSIPKKEFSLHGVR